MILLKNLNKNTKNAWIRKITPCCTRKLTSFLLLSFGSYFFVLLCYPCIQFPRIRQVNIIQTIIIINQSSFESPIFFISSIHHFKNVLETLSVLLLSSITIFLNIYLESRLMLRKWNSRYSPTGGSLLRIHCKIIVVGRYLTSLKEITFTLT